MHKGVFYMSISPSDSKNLPIDPNSPKRTGNLSNKPGNLAGRQIKKKPAAYKPTNLLIPVKNDPPKAQQKQQFSAKNPPKKRDVTEFLQDDIATQKLVEDDTQSRQVLSSSSDILSQKLTKIQNGWIPDDQELRDLLTELEGVNSHINSTDSDNAKQLHCVWERFQQLGDSLSDLHKLQYAVFIEITNPLLKNTSSKVEKSTAEALPKYRKAVNTHYGIHKFDRLTYKLPYSLIQDKNTGSVAILFKKKKSGSELSKGGFKIVKEALFVPKDRNEPAQKAVEAISSAEDSSQELNFLRIFNSAPGHVRHYFIRPYDKRGTSKVGILFERFDGALDQVTNLSYKQAGSIALQILNGLARMHELSIVHGDIKPANFLYKRDSASNIHAVLTDYGLSHYSNSNSPYTGYGTKSYASPEAIRNSSDPFGEPNYYINDVWAVGLSLLEIVTIQNNDAEKLRVKLLHDLANEADFCTWGEKTESGSSNDEVGEEAADNRAILCELFYKEVEELAKNTQIQNDDEAQNEVKFLHAIAKLLIINADNPLTCQEALKLFQSLKL